MKLHEEFKEYENLWEDANIIKVVFYLNKNRAFSSEADLLRTKLKKDNPNAFVLIEYRMSRFLEDCETYIDSKHCKCYTDAQGMEELKAACKKIPAEYKDIVDKTLASITIIDTSTLKN